MTSLRLLSIFLLYAGAVLPVRAADAPDSREFFEKRVRPVFAATCLPCHGTTRMGGLDMSSRDALIKGGNSGPALDPGKPEHSLLILAVNHQHEKLKMPLQQPKLSDERIADLVDWVRAGAVWPADQTAAAPKGAKFQITPQQKSFWAFQPVRKPAAPVVKNRTWPRNEVDRFLLAKMEAKGVRPAPPADARTLIRRAYFDLTGLPPTPADVDTFAANPSPEAFKQLVERLLASPRYGERWGRFWLDVARYSDDRLESEVDAPYANAFRYRDWVIGAFNDDMPYDRFVKAQIAGDLIDRDQLAAGLGFYALRPDTQDDRVDSTGRAFLGLTTGCAQCHNHKFDPIPTTDYYALQGVFESTENSEQPLAPDPVVKEYKAREKAVEDKKTEIRDFLNSQATQLASMLASQTARYLRAVRLVVAGREAGPVAEREHLDAETLGRWVRYVQEPAKDHPYLRDWADEGKFDPGKFQQQVLAVLRERKAVDEENLIRKAEAKRKGPQASTDAASLKTESFYLWRDLFFSDFYGNQFKQEDDGLLYYGPNRGFYESDGTVERFLYGDWKRHLEHLRAELTELKKGLPAQYPFLHTIKDSEKLRTERVHIGGSAENLGEDVPRRFLTILAPGGEPVPFTKGSGRLELAEAIASPSNPLTARVMVNRIWQAHFGAGLVRTPSDFGFMGDRPSHPELLDYLASRLVESGWSVKALHREIMLSAVYRAGSQRIAENDEIDPENRLLWRAPVRRMDAESLRDSLLAVSGELDLAAGGPPQPLTDAANRRRGVYGLVSRRKLDPSLALFDFPNPNISSEKRAVTITPIQQLYFLNGDFVRERAERLAARVSGAPAERVRGLYRLVFGREPDERELRLGLDFLGGGSGSLYAQALLTSNEFAFVK